RAGGERHRALRKSRARAHLPCGGESADPGRTLDRPAPRAVGTQARPPWRISRRDRQRKRQRPRRRQMTSPATLAKHSVVHETSVMERTYKAAPARVFGAWESVEARLRWSKPYAHTGLIYDAHDFRVGGKDVARCGPLDDMRFRAEVHYLDIVPAKRI